MKSKGRRMKRNPILDTLTNAEIREKHKELGSDRAVAKHFGISTETAMRGRWGSRQCPGKREGNLK